MPAFWWGVALVLMLAWSIYFFWTIKRQVTLRLLGLLFFAGVLIDVGINLGYIWHTNESIVATGLRCICIARALLPFFALLFALYFPNPYPLTRRSYAVVLLTIPVVISTVITDPFFYPKSESPQTLGVLAIWMTPYFLSSYALLIRSARKMRLPIMRHQVMTIAIGLIIATLPHLVTSIILPAFGYDDLWRHNAYWVVFACLFLGWGFLKHDIFRWRIRSHNRSLDLQIDAMSDGAKVLAHIMKNHMMVIDYLAAQAEQGRQEKLKDLRKTCQNICHRLDEVGVIPYVGDKSSFDLLSIDELLTEASMVVLPEEQSISYDRLPSSLQIRGAKEELIKAFRHLILNASEAMHQGGVIRIVGQQEGDYIVVAITDQGVGINEERLKSIFWPFNTSKSLYESWGLGLSFSHQVFAAHHGGLLVESQPGKGSTFIIFLPAINSGLASNYYI